jgi:uncharacterized protein YcaQ
VAAPEPHHLSAAEARRVAVAAQLLAEPRPRSLEEVLHHLTLLQDDPTAAVAPSADLVLWSRLGENHDVRELRDAVDVGAVVELHQMLRPAADIALHRAEMAHWPAQRGAPLTPWQLDLRDWMEANDGARLDVLEKLHDEGPLPSSSLPDTTVLPWRSSGWNDDRSLRKLLDCMVSRGEVAAAGRDGRRRLWDLAERVYPDVVVPPLAEALRERDRRRLAALGIARAKSAQTPQEPDDVGEAGEPAVVDGVRGTWRVDPAHLDTAAALAGRVAVLSPLDRLVLDRRRMRELFGFDYQLEMYKPAARRRWGYWAMPVLDGDRLVGKVDASADRDAGELRIDAVHEDEVDGEGWDGDRRERVCAEVGSLARWLGLEPVWTPATS